MCKRYLYYVFQTGVSKWKVLQNRVIPIDFNAQQYSVSNCTVLNTHWLERSSMHNNTHWLKSASVHSNTQQLKRCSVHSSTRSDYKNTSAVFSKSPSDCNLFYRNKHATLENILHMKYQPIFTHFTAIHIYITPRENWYNSKHTAQNTHSTHLYTQYTHCTHLMYEHI